MNLSDLHKYVVELIRDHPDALAALLIGAVVSFAAGFGLAWRYFRNAGRKEIARLRAEAEALRRDDYRGRKTAIELALVRQQVQAVAKRAYKFRSYGKTLQRQLRAEVGARAEDAERHREVADQLTADLDDARTRLADLEPRHDAARAEADALQAQLDRLDEAVNATGNVWLRDPLDPPPGRPQPPRDMPVVAVLNFKGGVGKTTLTANLAPVLAGRGERVLVIDLDYQGSLTALALPGDRIRVAAAERRLAHDLFAAEPTRDLLVRLAERGGDPAEPFHVVGAVDALADCESRLFARWVLRPDGPDPRYLLRAAVDAARARGDFDRVLIDCPPRLTAACVNALACCNYLVVPVLLDATSTLAAPRLLHLLREFRPLLDRLHGIGLVANRTQFAELTAGERDTWDELATKCRDEWGRPLDRFATGVPQLAAFRHAANARRLAAVADRGVRDTFGRLAAELAERVPCESRRVTPVPG